MFTPKQIYLQFLGHGMYLYTYQKDMYFTWYTSMPAAFRN